ncbi:hypothetical protein ACFQGE_14690 [Halomicroarcula sp. GCM10025817]|uniref:hypothetical protein n=1 Tax=Haloarcula TaxID=2237 RepID=UPI0023E7E2F8|nr:hypothetical protein [Halomicroarcula sp. SYNS111]
MADLLTHVLVPYVVLTVTSWWVEVPRQWVVVAMCGAAIPDLVKAKIVVFGLLDVRSVFGVDLAFAGFNRLGGALLLAAAVAVFFGDRWRRAYAFIAFGGLSSLLVDGLRVYADGRADFYLYPLTWWRPPTPSLYVTSDPRVLGTALTVSIAVFLADRYRRHGRLLPDGEASAAE